MKGALEPSGIRVLGNWYWSASVQKLFEARGTVEVDVRIDTEDLGAISLKQDKGWLTVVGPKVMDHVSVAVWEAAQADLRRQNLAFKEMISPVVNRAISYARKADEATRKRLLVQYLPMTGADFARARRLNWINVPNTDEVDRAPETQPDLFAGKLKVGTKPDRPRDQAPEFEFLPPGDAPPTPVAEVDSPAPTPAKTRKPKPTPPPEDRARPPRPSRRWNFKDRKS